MAPTSFIMRLALALLALIGAVGMAAAHPHVWVTMKTEVVYAPDGSVTGVRQAWTFDEAFTAFALQGMERNKDGSYPDSVLKPLAEVNVTSLKEYDYFTFAKSAKAKLKFKDPVDYRLTFGDDALTLHFFLPLEKPFPARGLMTFEIYDPTMFVAFAFAEKDAVSLASPPTGCAYQVISPAPMQTGQLSESFFSNLTANNSYAAQFADRIQVKCP